MVFTVRPTCARRSRASATGAPHACTAFQTRQVCTLGEQGSRPASTHLLSHDIPHPHTFSYVRRPLLAHHIIQYRPLMPRALAYAPMPHCAHPHTERTKGGQAAGARLLRVAQRGPVARALLRHKLLRGRAAGLAGVGRAVGQLAELLVRRVGLVLVVLEVLHKGRAGACARARARPSQALPARRRQPQRSGAARQHREV